jgi:hypothetical protein
MPTSFSCQRASVPLICIRSERLRARRSAVSVWSRTREKNLSDNKKPGVERRASPSIPWATQFVRPLGRMCSKLDCLLSGVGNQPHLILVGRPGLSADYPPNPGTANIGKVYQNPKSRQVAFKIFLCPVDTSRREFHRPMWKNRVRSSRVPVI